MSARRELVLAIVGCLGGAAVALFAAAQVWTVEVTPRPDPLPALRVERSGGSLLPWLPAIAVVALAGAGALPATRRSGRAALGVLLLAAGGGIAAGGGWGLAHDGAWPALCVAGGLLVAAAGALAAVRGRRWHSMGARYDRAAAPRRPADRPSDEASLWDALDRGEDPTLRRS